MDVKARVTFFLLSMIPKLSFAVGIGSQGWGDQAGMSDPIGGILLVTACLGVLFLGWVQGKASLNAIYIPTFIGALILFLILQKFSLKALVGYLILGLILGQVLRLFFGDFWLRKSKSTANSTGVTGPISSSPKMVRVCQSPPSMVGVAPPQCVTQPHWFDEELEQAKARRIIKGPNSKERVSLLVKLILEDHIAHHDWHEAAQGSIVLNQQGDPRIVRYFGLGANDLAMVSLAVVAERIQAEIVPNGEARPDDRVINLMRDVIIEEFYKQCSELVLLQDRA